MSEGRRSARSRKTIDYTAFGADDNDDDFADPTPPPKKSKGANKENKLKRKNDEVTKVNSSENKRGRRQSLDDKVFDRDLETALKLSTELSQQDEVTEVAVEAHCDDDFNKTDKNDTHLVDTTLKSTSGTKSDVQGHLPSIAKLDDDIIQLSDEEAQNSRRRKAASKPVKYDDNDDGSGDNEDVWNPAQASKYDSENDSEDLDDDDDEFDPDDSDSDYGSSKKKKGNMKKAKSKPSAKKVTTPKPKPVSKVTVTPVNKSKPAPVKKSNSKSSVKSAPSTQFNRTPNRISTGGLKKAWVPPARSGSISSPLSGVSIKSPSSGLRLGLSRNQKVKPLHPSVTS